MNKLKLAALAVLLALAACTTPAPNSTVTITQKGTIALTKDGAVISQHAVEREATERALNTGPGTYVLKQPDIEIKVAAATTPPDPGPGPTPPPTGSEWTTLPKVLIDTTYAEPTKVVNVAAGGNLQAAILAATPGTTIVLPAGATFNGPINLPNKTGTGWIYIKSGGTLPKPGNRIRPADAAQMATIVGTGSPVIAVQTAAGAHHYRFVGIRFIPQAGTFATSLFRIGNGETSAAQLPNNITIDRCLMTAEPAKGGRRALGANGAYVAVIDSHLSGWREEGADSQALFASNSPGPIKLVNNYLEGAGENVMFGGDDPSVPGLEQADIEVRGNYMFKPTEWRTQRWSVKNLFEIKHAKRILIEGNVMENSWAADQDFAVNIKSSNQNNTAPQSGAYDVTFRLNIIRHASNGIKLCGQNCDGTPTAAGSRFLVENNLFDDINSVKWGGDGTFMQTTSNIPGLVMNKNTVNNNGGIFKGGDGGRSAGFRFTDNIVVRGTSGFKGSGAAEGTGTLNTFFPGWVFTGNALVKGQPYASSYPPGNTFPATAPSTGGADMAAVNAATRCSVTGQCVQ